VTLTPQAILETLPTSVRGVLEAATTGPGNLYLVGGLVRDVLLGANSDFNDIDLVVEGVSSFAAAHHLQETLGGKLECHEAFGTCTLHTQEHVIDIVTARSEHYDPPGTLPEVSFSTIKDDLARRDFSVNALALRLQPGPLELLDLHNSLRDLQNKQLRILHEDSFIDDPTRIVRGSRLAGRLDFTWEKETRLAIHKALVSPTLSNVTKDRLKAEFGATLAEKRVTPALELLDECNALTVLFDLTLDATMTTRLDTLRQTLDVPDESYLLTLLLMKHGDKVESWLATFNYPLHYLDSIGRLRDIQKTRAVSSQQFVKLSHTEKMTVRSFSDELDKRIQDLIVQFKERRLSGQDVLDLGLESGPEVGKLLAQVAKARDAGRVRTFDDELELAKKLTRELLGSRTRERQ
jgi:tRNA nucleotidyltransferase (CCA-adding enzyme)